MDGEYFKYEAKNSVKRHDVASWPACHCFISHRKWKAHVSRTLIFHGCNSIIELDIQVRKLKFSYICYHWPQWQTCYEHKILPYATTCFFYHFNVFKWKNAIFYFSDNSRRLQATTWYVKLYNFHTPLWCYRLGKVKVKNQLISNLLKQIQQVA